MPFLRAMILGVTGRVGAALAAHLLAYDAPDDTDENMVLWSVAGAARCSSHERSLAAMRTGVDLLTFDVTQDDPALLPDADVLFLEVWDPARPENVWPLNVWGAGRVAAEYARRMGEKLTIVNGTTIAVYGEGPRAAVEDAPCRPAGEYAHGRWAEERLIDGLCARHGCKGVHVRLAHANTAEGGIVRKMAERITRGESLGERPDERLQIIAMEDAVRVTAAAAITRAANPPAIVNCCHPRVWTMRELAGDIHRRLRRGSVVFDAGAGGPVAKLSQVAQLSRVAAVAGEKVAQLSRVAAGAGEKVAPLSRVAAVEGGLERSVYADARRMIEWFGEPQVPLDTVIGRVVEDMNAAPARFIYLNS